MTNNWGILFDVDGTMVDNTRFHQQAWIELGKRHGIPITSEYYHDKMHARTNQEIAKILFGSTNEPEYGARIASEKEAIYREIFAPFMRPLPGLLDLLTAVRKAGIPCAVASNAPRDNVSMIIDGLNIRSHFDMILTGEDIHVGKPDPAIFIAAAQGLQLPIEHCIIFEDSPSGLLAAQRSGAVVVGVMGTRTNDQLPKEISHCQLIVQNYSALTLARLAGFFDFQE